MQNSIAVWQKLSSSMPTSERLFRSVEITGGGVAGPALARFEGRHRRTGGNALRAAVLGASDGLTTNLSLVMGVAGANLPGHTILFTGLAGMLAGVLSMSIGEWLSAQSARELYTHQIAVERQELVEMPEELALIYEAKGIDRETANRLAEHIMSQGEHTGWFVESLATQTLVLFIILTVGNPLRSRPSFPLTITTISIVCVGMLLPFTPVAGSIGFTPLPALYFLFLAVMVVTYLLLVEIVKRRLMRRLVKRNYRVVKAY